MHNGEKQADRDPDGSGENQRAQHGIGHRIRSGMTLPPRMLVADMGTERSTVSGGLAGWSEHLSGPSGCAASATRTGRHLRQYSNNPMPGGGWGETR